MGQPVPGNRQAIMASSHHWKSSGAPQRKTSPRGRTSSHTTETMPGGGPQTDTICYHAGSPTIQCRIPARSADRRFRAGDQSADLLSSGGHMRQFWAPGGPRPVGCGPCMTRTAWVGRCCTICVAMYRGAGQGV